MTPDVPPEPPRIELHGWAEAGVSVAMGAEEDAVPQVAIDMARMQLRYDDRHYGGMIQISAAGGNVRLLDAVARLGAKGDGLSLQAGLFKTPLSLDFGIPAPKMVLPHRPWLVGAGTTRELGVQGRLRGSAGTVWLGLYDPVSDLTVTGRGVRTVVAGEAPVSERVLLHAGASTWVHGRGAPDILGEDAPEWDHMADLGVRYDHAGTVVAVEGLASHQADGPLWQAGASVWAAHRFPVGGVELEPAAAWETATFTGEVHHRATSVLNLHESDWNLVASLSWDVVLTEGPTAHIVRTQLQTGF